MELSRKRIIEFLRDRGESEMAERASQQLPERVDPERDRAVLDRIGIDPEELLSNLGGQGNTRGL